jgi:hypothetical protein
MPHPIRLVHNASSIALEVAGLRPEREKERPAVNGTALIRNEDKL